MNRLLRLILRRLIISIPVLLIVVIGVFLLLNSAGGDAVDAYLAAMGGGDAELAARLREQYGLDGSTFGRLMFTLGQLAQGNLGQSIALNRPIADVIAERLPNTLWLMGSATAMSFVLGSALGIVAGRRPGSASDRLLSGGSLLLYSVPSFWLGLVLSVAFAVQLRWFPVSGIETVASGKTGLARAADIAWHLVLPVTALGVIYLALFLRIMRSGMVEAWGQDYTLAARARGLSGWRITLNHAARNALLPLITMLGLQAASMLGGSVVIESVFAIPGFGRLAQEAVAVRDAPLLMGVILVSALMVILANLLVDLAYGLIDPRIGSNADGRPEGGGRRAA
ncbi:ABC transporter permease [Paracoccus pacificus]|uniref:ABC transporter permease n=1 Tax=Paracoccus pacificus TaxID=1463598 RepID=A0ABW4R9D3_9RHOB